MPSAQRMPVHGFGESFFGWFHRPSWTPSPADGYHDHACELPSQSARVSFLDVENAAHVALVLLSYGDVYNGQTFEHAVCRTKDRDCTRDWSLFRTIVLVDADGGLAAAATFVVDVSTVYVLAIAAISSYGGHTGGAGAAPGAPPLAGQVGAGGVGGGFEMFAMMYALKALAVQLRARQVVAPNIREHQWMLHDFGFAPISCARMTRDLVEGFLRKYWHHTQQTSSRWAQCDACNKWRALPKYARAPVASASWWVLCSRARGRVARARAPR